MTDESIAWMIVVGSGLLALGFWFLITRSVGNGFLRSWLRCLAAVCMLLPAPLPGYPGHFAPAYVVALFEAVFQENGEPQQAFIILGGGAILVTILLIAWSLLRPRRRTEVDQAAEPS